MDKIAAKPRVVLVFEDEAEFAEFKNYAKAKALDIKNFLKFSAKTYMVKYPLKTAQKEKDE